MPKSMDQMVNSFIKVVRNENKNKTYNYSGNADVVRMDETGNYIKFKGSDIETPVKLAVSAKVGDRVIAEIMGNRAVVTGNVTAPPKEKPDDTDLPDYSIKVVNNSEIQLISNDKIISRSKINVEALWE